MVLYLDFLSCNYKCLLTLMRWIFSFRLWAKFLKKVLELQFLTDCVTNVVEILNNSLEFIFFKFWCQILFLSLNLLLIQTLQLNLPILSPIPPISDVEGEQDWFVGPLMDPGNFHPAEERCLCCSNDTPGILKHNFKFNCH